MKKSKKGGALITAIMVILILLSLTAGIITLITMNHGVADANYSDRRLFYSAQAGLNHARSILENQVDEFVVGTAHNKINSTAPFELNGCSVKLSSSYDPKDESYTVNALAIDTKNGYKCLQSLQFISYTRWSKSTGMVSDMSKGTEFSGSTNSNTVNFDTFMGDMYFGGLLNIKDTPVFDGKIESASRLSSKRSNENDRYSYGQTADDRGINKGQTDLLQNLLGGRFLTGVWDKTTNSEDAGTLGSRYTSAFPKGYETVGKINFDNSAVYSWNELNSVTPPPGVNKESITATSYNSNATIQILKDKIEYRINGGRKKSIAIGSGGANTILFDKKISKIYIKESVINTNVSIVSQEADYEVVDDIVLDGYQKYAEYSESWGSNDNIKKLRDDIYNDENAVGHLGLITYEGDVLINESAAGAPSTISDETTRDVLLLMASFFAPNGVYGVGESTNDFRRFPEDWSKKHVINIGSVLMDKKGYFRSGSRGMYGKFCDDKRFSIGMDLPSVFKPLVITNPEHDNEDFMDTNEKVMNWTCNYRYN